MRVLITNDDGIDSPGLMALAGVARDRGHDTFVAAPSWDSSGASASVTGVVEGQGLLIESRSWPDWPADAVLSVNATPALICRSALEGAFGSPPDLVLSGINRGPNTGHAILHSGTVGAALTAYQGRRPALAVSLDVAQGAGEHWATAAAVAGVVVDWLIGTGRVLAINCNVPDVPTVLLRGVRVAHLAPVGTVQTSMTERTGEALALPVGERDGGGADARRAPRLGPDRATGRSQQGEPGTDLQFDTDAVLETDTELLAQGFAALTAVIPIVEDPTIDLAAVFGRARS